MCVHYIILRGLVGSLLRYCRGALVRPILEYGCVAWVIAHNYIIIKRIQRVPNRFLRFPIVMSYMITHQLPMRFVLSSLRVERKRTAGICWFIEGLFNGKIASLPPSFFRAQVLGPSTTHYIGILLPLSMCRHKYYFLANESRKSFMTNANLREFNFLFSL